MRAQTACKLEEVTRMVANTRHPSSTLGITLFAICGNGEKPVGPAQKTALIDNHLAKLCEVGDLPSKVFNGRITKSLMDPESRKRMEEPYPKFAGKPLEDYDLPNPRIAWRSVERLESFLESWGFVSWSLLSSKTQGFQE
jgi:hypothetical protein